MDKYIKCEDAKAAFCRYMGFTSKRAAIAVESIVDKIPAADVVERPKWISVEERLPEESEDLNWHEDKTIRLTSVWCCDVKTGTIEVRNRLQGKITGIEYLDQYTPDTDWHWSKSWWEPTHWMPIVPLPESQKEVNQS